MDRTDEARGEHETAGRDSPVTTPGVGRDALGMGPPPGSAPPAAEVDGSERLVPGADYGERPPTDRMPWFTSLAFGSDAAGLEHLDDEQKADADRR